MTNDNLLWTLDEYQAVIDYKWNYFNAINVLLSSNLTRREIRGLNRKLPQTPEKFKIAIEKAISLYSAIIKNYTLNGRKEYGKKLFRGTRAGKIDMSFLSTSDSVSTAFEFAKGFEQTKRDNGVLLVIEILNTPWINLDMTTDGQGLREPEILVLPSQIESLEELSLSECFDIAKQQGETIQAEQIILKKFSSLRELDYSGERTDLSIEDLCNMYEQYIQDIDTVRSTVIDSTEYDEAYKRVLQFKEKCCTFMHQRFYEIHQSIDSQSKTEENGIQVSSEYDMKEVFIGNTGEMYHVVDRGAGEEYYFKPAVSKNGSDRPYIAHIQEAAYRIQQIINPEHAVKCNTIQMNGMFGAIQEKVSIDIEATKAFIEYFDKGRGELTPEIINQVLDEYLVDFCLCNYDSHASNFIIDKSGRLRGIDKEQSFRYIKEDENRDMTFTTNYNENYGEKPAIYNTLFEQMKQRKISYKYLDSLRYRASRLAQYPDEQYIKIFEQYAYGKVKTPEEAESLLSRILDRKRGILQNVEQLYEDIYNKRYKNKTSSVLSSAIETTEGATRTGLINEQAQTIKNAELSKAQDKEEQK